MPKLLLLGTGNIAGHHIREFAEIPECSIVACVDRIPGRASAFAEANGIARAFDELDEAVQLTRQMMSGAAVRYASASYARRAAIAASTGSDLFAYRLDRTLQADGSTATAPMLGGN